MSYGSSRVRLRRGAVLQADPAKRSTEVGLVLSLVKAVVEAHHGRVAVSSQEGAGSEFTVTLPK